MADRRRTWSLFHDVPVLRDIQDEMNRLFPVGQFLPVNREGAGAVAETRWSPRVDVIEEKDRFIYCLDVPGISTEDLKISVEDNVLKIEGERKTEYEEKKGNFSYKERFFGSFCRLFELPSTADPSKVQAKLKKGVAEVIVAKKETSVPQKVHVEVEE